MESEAITGWTLVLTYVTYTTFMKELYGQEEVNL
jgi:hypothetical protein